MQSQGVQESLLDTFMSALTGPCAVKNNDSVLVCVSGGIDSMVLLDLMRCASQSLDLRLGVIHVDHGLRKKESGQDAFFVQEWCQKLSLEFYLARLMMTPGTANLEEEARKMRYDAIRDFKTRHGYAFAATGHTLEDQAETVLYRIIRGTGIRGLAGMEYKRPDGLIRPMLGISRTRVKEYATAQGLAYVNDSTNTDLRLARNLIRSAVIPVMERINPQAARSITSLAHIAREEGAALENMALDLEKNSAVFDYVMIKSFRADDLRSAPDAVTRRLLINVISRMAHEPRGIDAIQVDAAFDVLRAAIRAHTIKRRVKVLLDGSLLVVHRVSPGPHYSLEIKKRGSIFIPEINKTVNIIAPMGTTGNFRLRSYMRGDRMSGKKVSEILAGMKIPRTLRPFWPVLTLHEATIAVAAKEKGQGGLAMTLEESHGE